jgi:hypothetical protein
MATLVTKQSGSGVTIHGINHNHRIQWLVSQHNPQREAERLMLNSPKSDIAVLFGWGSGIAPSLALQTYTRVVVIEPTITRTARVLEDIERLTVLYEGRLDVLWWNISMDESQNSQSKEIDELKQLLMGFTLSFICSTTNIIQLPGYSSAFLKQSKHLAQTFRSCLDDVTKEFGLYKTFGNLWLENYIRNIPEFLSKTQSSPSFVQKFLQGLRQATQIIVLGAGPSLLEGLDWLSNCQENLLVLAADTCAPALAKVVKPNLNIVFFSLDAQWYTQYHSRWIDTNGFLGWIIEGSIHPSLVRNLDSQFIWFSNHPIIGYLNRFKINPKRIGLYSAQSGLAALSAGQYLSEQTLLPLKIFGVDGKFRSFKAYGPGTYLQSVLLGKNSRLNSRETQEFLLMSRGKPNSMYWIRDGYGSSFYTKPTSIPFGEKLVSALMAEDSNLFKQHSSIDQISAAILNDLSYSFVDSTSLHLHRATFLTLPGALKALDQNNLMEESFLSRPNTLFSALEFNRKYLYSRISEISKV